MIFHEGKADNALSIQRSQIQPSNTTGHTKGHLTHSRHPFP